MARVFCCFLLLASLLKLSFENDPEGVILDNPMNITATPDGSSVNFTCNTLGTQAYWLIDGNSTNNPNVKQAYKQAPYNFIFDAPEDNDNYYNITMHIPARLEFNSTEILCKVTSTNHNRVSSEIAILTIAGVPLPPPLAVVVMNNLVILSWDRPFTLSNYPVLLYSLQLENFSSGVVLEQHLQLTENITSFIYNISSVPSLGQCLVIHVSLSATNAVGESQDSNIYTALSTDIEPFASGSVNAFPLFMADGSAFLYINMKLPDVCYFQEMNYTILIEADDGSGIVTVGPKTVQEHQALYCPPDPDKPLVRSIEVTEVVSVGLAPNANYTIRVRVDTNAGSATSDPVYASTVFDLSTTSGRQQDHIVYAVLGAYAAIVSVLLFISVMLLCACHRKIKRPSISSKGEVGKAQRAMVNNPIYEGHSSGPVYECIRQSQVNNTQQTSCESPSTASIRYLENHPKASPVVSSASSSPSDEKKSMMAAESPCGDLQDEGDISIRQQVREKLQLPLTRKDTKIHVNGSINLAQLQDPLSPTDEVHQSQSSMGTDLRRNGSRRATRPTMIPTTGSTDTNYTIMSPAGTVSRSVLSAGWGESSPEDSNKYAE